MLPCTRFSCLMAVVSFLSFLHGTIMSDANVSLSLHPDYSKHSVSCPHDGHIRSEICNMHFYFQLVHSTQYISLTDYSLYLYFGQQNLMGL